MIGMIIKKLNKRLPVEQRYNGDLMRRRCVRVIFTTIQHELGEIRRVHKRQNKFANCLVNVL